MNYKDKIYSRLEHINEELSISLSKRLLESEHTGICTCCGEYKNTVKVREQNTQYTDKDSNYVESCIECFEEIQEYWQERWRDYYSSRL